MSSHPLEFELIDDHNRSFLVQFETESPNRNLLMDVIYQGLPLDTTDIKNYDLQLYLNIVNMMSVTSLNFWEKEVAA